MSPGVRIIRDRETHRPDLGVGYELEGETVDRHEQTLQVGELGGGEAQKAGVVVKNGSGCAHVPAVGISRRVIS